MTNVNWIKGSLDEAAVLDALREQSLSKDKAVACAARLFRETVPGLQRWIEAEIARGTDPAIMASAACDLACSAMTSTAATLSDGYGPKTAVRAMMMADQFLSGYARSVKELAAS